MVAPVGTYLAAVGSQTRELPIVPLTDELAIALLITVDHGVSFVERAGAEIAAILAPFDIEVVVSVATMGIPVAIEVSRSLDLDDYLILQKTPKIHLADAIAEPLRSITTDSTQRLLFDRERLNAVSGKRVALVDDVVSTGASIRAALALLRHVGSDPVAIGAIVTEAELWHATLADDADLVHALGTLPLFRRGPNGLYVEDWTGGDAPI